MGGRLAAILAGLICYAGLLAGQSHGARAAEEHAQKGLQYAQTGDLSQAEAELRRAVELVSTNATYLTSLGGILGMEQRLAEANVYFEKAVNADPQNASALRNLAANQWQLGQLKQSQVNLERLLRMQPDDKAAILLLGMVSENQHEYARAARLLGAVPELIEQHPEAVAALASAYYHLARREEAHKLLEGLLGRPAPPQGIFAAAGVAAQAQDYETAEKLFESILASYSDKTALEYNLALIQFRTQRVAESRQTLLELVRNGRVTGEVYNLLARCYQKENNLAEAARAMETAVRLEPAKESNYLDLLTILIDGNRLAAALEEAHGAVEAFPQSEAVYRMKGSVEMKTGEFTDAIQSYRRAAQLNPQSLDAELGLASAKWAAGLRAEAEAAFEALRKKYSREAAVYETYGTLLLDVASDGTAQARAAALLRKAVALDSSRAEPHYQLGLLELKKSPADVSPDSLARARDELEIAARLRPNQSRIHYALARVYRRLGREEEAAREMELYQQLQVAENVPNSSQTARRTPDP